MISDAGHLFMVGICISSLAKWLFKSFAYFSIVDLTFRVNKSLVFNYMDILTKEETRKSLLEDSISSILYLTYR